jgi:hypothetical protein
MKAPEPDLAQGYLFPTPTTSCKVVPSSGQRSAKLGELFDRLFFEVRRQFNHKSMAEVKCTPNTRSEGFIWLGLGSCKGESQ